MDVTRHLRIFRPAESDDVVVEPTPVVNSGPPDAAVVNPEPLDEADARHGSAVLHVLSRLIPFNGTLLLLLVLTGCSAFRPLKGVPVRQLPWELRGESRANMEPVDLSRLGQTRLPAHLIDSGDILAIYVEGVLGRVEDVPPINLPQDGESNPTLGYPIPVRDDGTISLPLIRPLSVRGLTISQTEELVRRTYTTETQILIKGQERVLVSLQKARTYKITVLRQESTNVPLVSVGTGGSVQLGSSKQGTGQIIVLQAGENDVLHALTLSGGLPGLDAQNALYVIRRPRLGANPANGGFFSQRQQPQPTSQGKVMQASLVNGSHQTPIHLTSGAKVKTGGRYSTVSNENYPVNPPPWGHSAPQTDSAQSIELEATQTADHATNVGFRQGLSQALPLRQRAMAAPYSFPQTGNSFPQTGTETLPPGMPMPGPAEIPMSYPKEIEPFVAGGSHVIRIPIYLRPGEEALFAEPDIILFDGDILFIESRQTEIFYTGGLLGGGQYQLPRDYDLKVLAAISIAQGSQNSGGGGSGFGSRIGGISAVNQDISVSASNLVIIRPTPDGGVINIKVDLNRVLRDPNENILIQPGDHLILRYKPLEAVGAFVERNLLAGSLFGLAASQATTRK